MLRKNIIFSLILILLMAVFMESTLHVFYRFVKGVWVWEVPKQHDVFNVRAFTEFVGDDRLITNKKNFSCVVSKNRVYLHEIRDKEVGSWPVETDRNGFRVGTNRYYAGRENIVFLGDSVPFGWGVSGDESVPSDFYNILKKALPGKYGVINAAIPSYSLYQSHLRYEKEIDGKYPVRYVILQIYDPALQFIMWGQKWDKRICWTSRDTLVSSDNVVRKDLRKPNIFQLFLQKYSSVWHAIYCFKKRLESAAAIPVRLDVNDEKAFDHFEKENTSILEDFYALLKKEDANLIILPVNPVEHLAQFSDAALKKFSLRRKALLVSTARLNEILRSFAGSHEGVYYFDVVSYFDRIGRKGMYIDDCHLTEAGTQKQAEFIFERMRANDLL